MAAWVGNKVQLVVNKAFNCFTEQLRALKRNYCVAAVCPAVHCSVWPLNLCGSVAEIPDKNPSATDTLPPQTGGSSQTYQYL